MGSEWRELQKAKESMFQQRVIAFWVTIAIAAVIAFFVALLRAPVQCVESAQLVGGTFQPQHHECEGGSHISTETSTPNGTLVRCTCPVTRP